MVKYDYELLSGYNLDSLKMPFFLPGNDVDRKLTKLQTIFI
jgi:hypothetical protein